MLNFFKKKEEEGEGVMPKSSLSKGLIFGLGGALIIVLIILGVVFGGQIKDKLTGKSPADSNQSADAAKVRVTIITKKDCVDCWDVNLLIDALKQNNVNITGQETVYIDDAKTKTLIDKYKITKVPTVLVAGELEKNDSLKQIWQTLGEIIDNVFVFRQVIPPYIDVATGQLKGKFSAIYLTDKSCSTCYDVKIHENALKNLGMNPTNAKEVDVASDEGKALVAKYKITKVPTLILNGELAEYQSLTQVWPTVGEIASDGAYVLTKAEEMGTYRNLTTGKIVVVQPQTATSTAPAVAQ